MRIFVTGGTGDLGRRLVPRLAAAGHDVVVGTRRPGSTSQIRYSFDMEVDDLVSALTGSDTVVHLASDPTSREADIVATERLADAAERAGVGHLLYVSIVGVDANPLTYYRVKLAAEAVVSGSSVPWTILRTTQFHSLLPRFAERLSVGPVTIVPAGVRIQPIDPEVVAARVVELVEAGPSGRVPDLGGPEELTFVSAAREYLRAAGRRRVVLPLPLVGSTMRALRNGVLLAPERRAGGRTYARFLAGEDHDRPRLDGVGRMSSVLGWSLVAVAGWMAVSPRGFVAGIADFGPTSGHFVRDLATFTAPLGGALILAVSRPRWRVPVFGVAAAQNGLHLLNHLADVGAARVAWHGPANVAALTAVEVALLVGLRTSRRSVRSGTGRAERATG